MKRRHVFTVMILITALAVGGFFSYRRTVPALAARPNDTSSATGSAANLPWPSYGESAIGADGYGVLATHGTQKPVPTASVTKIMTALAVLSVKPLKHGEQGPVITLTQADVNSYDKYYLEGGSLVKVAKGEKITEYQALEAMLLPSANNMADTLAKWAFGSVANYSTYANKLAQQFNMLDTHIGSVDASGFDPSTTSTAQDLVLLGEAALENPILAQIVSQKTANVPVAGTINNVNRVLGEAGINGIKTGSNDQDPGVYLFSAPRTLQNGQTVTIVGAIMGSKTVQRTYVDAIALLNSVTPNFVPRTVVKTGQVVGHYKVPWGGMVDAVAAKSLDLMVWKGTVPTPKVSLEPFRAPLAKGTKVGTLSFSVSSSQAVSVITDTSVDGPTWQWRLLHPF